MENVTTTQRLVRAREFYTRLGLSKTKFFSCVKSGSLPKPVHVTTRHIAWPIEQVDAVLGGILSGDICL